MQIISLTELRSLPSSTQLFEVLSESHFNAGHLPGAKVMPLDRIAEVASRAVKTATVIVYCASETCQNSHIAAQKLATLGFVDVRVFAGGKAAWKEAGLALETSAQEAAVTP